MHMSLKHKSLLARLCTLMASLEALQAHWLSGPDGKLCAREQAKAWALRELWREDGRPEHGMYSFIATKVVKNSDGKPRGGHPVSQSISDFFSKVDNDKDWFPGKHTDTHRGPKRVLRDSKLTAVVSAAKRLRSEGNELTYSAVLAACPKAVLTPNTGEPVD